MKVAFGWISVAIVSTCGLCGGIGWISLRREDADLAAWRKQVDGLYFDSDILAPRSRYISHRLLVVTGNHYKLMTALTYADRPGRDLNWSVAEEGDMESLGVGVFTMSRPYTDTSGRVLDEIRTTQAKFYLDGTALFEEFKAFKVMRPPLTEAEAAAAEADRKWIPEGIKPFGYAR